MIFTTTNCQVSYTTLFHMLTTNWATNAASSSGYSLASFFDFPSNGSCLTHAGHLQTLANCPGFSNPSNLPANCEGLNHLVFCFLWKLQVLNFRSRDDSGRCQADPTPSSPGGEPPALLLAAQISLTAALRLVLSRSHPWLHMWHEHPHGTPWFSFFPASNTCMLQKKGLVEVFAKLCKSWPFLK